MRFYSDSEIDLLIEEITEAAHEAIEQAAGEAARAAVISMLEREVEAYREAQRWRLEAEANLLAITQAKKAGVKNAILAGAICIVTGFVLGAGGTLIIGGR